MKKNQITTKILKSIAQHSLIDVAHIADFILGPKYDVYRERRFQKSYIKRRFNQMLDQKLIVLEKENGKTHVHLTDTGETKLQEYELGELKIERPKRWDGKWRLVIFDIHERRRRARDLLRLQLQELGLIRLQNSVWVYPYDCSEIIILFKANAMIGKDILCLTVEELENDGWLRKHFRL